MSANGCQSRVSSSVAPIRRLYSRVRCPYWPKLATGPVQTGRRRDGCAVVHYGYGREHPDRLLSADAGCRGPSWERCRRPRSDPRGGRGGRSDRDSPGVGPLRLRVRIRGGGAGRRRSPPTESCWRAGRRRQQRGDALVIGGFCELAAGRPRFQQRGAGRRRRCAGRVSQAAPVERRVALVRARRAPGAGGRDASRADRVWGSVTTSSSRS